MKVERERFRSLQVSSSDVFFSAVTRNLMTCVLLFAPSGANHEQGLGQARPNKITSEMQTHCRSEVPDGQNIFKN